MAREGNLIVVGDEDWGTVESKLEGVVETGQDDNVADLDDEVKIRRYNQKWNELSDGPEGIESHAINAPIDLNGECNYLDMRAKGRQVYTIMITNPFSHEAMRIFRNQTLPRCIPQPENWLFLIQGPLEFINMPTEAQYAIDCAKDLGITVEDPIVPAFNRELAEVASVRLYSAVQVYTMTNHQRYKAAGKEDLLISNAAKLFKKPEPYISAVMTHTFEDMGKSRKNKDTMERRIKEIHNALKLASLELSHMRLGDLLVRHEHPVVYLQTHNDYQDLVLGNPRMGLFSRTDYRKVMDAVEARNAELKKE